MYSYTYAGKQLHTEGFTQPPVETLEGKQLTRLMRRQCFMERSNSSFRCYAKGGERLRSLNNSSNNNINRETDVVRNCNIIVTMSTLHLISVTQGSKPARLVTAPTRTRTSVWTMPLVLVTYASVTTGSSKLTGHVPHVSVWLNASLIWCPCWIRKYRFLSLKICLK